MPGGITIFSAANLIRAEFVLAITRNTLIIGSAHHTVRKITLGVIRPTVVPVVASAAGIAATVVAAFFTGAVGRA